MINAAEFKNHLNQFTGTDRWYRHGLNKACLYTDGVRFFVEEAGAYWLLDILATEFFELQRKVGFLSVTLKVAGNQASLLVEDGDYKELACKFIEYTDCPEGEWKFFFTNEVLLLPSEY